MSELMPNKKILINLSAIIPTMDRENILYRTLKSFSYQSLQPKEIIIVDASVIFKKNIYSNIENLKSRIIHVEADEKGAAKQRNQAITLSSYPNIGFFDDDILLEKDCIEILWQALNNNPQCGGINSVITNQTYHPLGVVSRIFYRIMGADTTKSLAGKCIGPAINFWPDKNADNDITEVDWLFSGCTFYRKEALPQPVFDNHFQGYSLMEDLALSLRVGKNWTLLNSKNAKIFHDSQPSEEKKNLSIIAEMDLVNRYYIMKNILYKNSFKDHIQLFLQQLFGAVTSKRIFSISYLKGKYTALKKLKAI